MAQPQLQLQLRLRLRLAPPVDWQSVASAQLVLRQSRRRRRRPNPTWPHGNMGNCIQIVFELKIKIKKNKNEYENEHEHSITHSHIGVVHVQWLFKIVRYMLDQLQLISAPQNALWPTPSWLNYSSVCVCVLCKVCGAALQKRAFLLNKQTNERL